MKKEIYQHRIIYIYKMSLYNERKKWLFRNIKVERICHCQACSTRNVKVILQSEKYT